MDHRRGNLALKQFSKLHTSKILAHARETKWEVRKLFENQIIETGRRFRNWSAWMHRQWNFKSLASIQKSGAGHRPRIATPVEHLRQSLVQMDPTGG
jgi:hypothetical protein